MKNEKEIIDAVPSEDDFLDEMDRTISAERRQRVFRGILFWFCAACLAGLLVYAFGHVSVNTVKRTDSASGLPAGSVVITQQKRGETTGRVLRYTNGGNIYLRRGSELTEKQTETLFQRGQMESASGFAQALSLGFPVLLLGIFVILVREIIAGRRYRLPDEAYED